MNDLLPQLVMAAAAGGPLAAALLLSLSGRGARRPAFSWIAAACAALPLAAGVTACGLLLRPDAVPAQPWIVYRWMNLPDSGPLALTLRVDHLTAMFLVVSGLAALAVAACNNGNQPAADSSRHFHRNAAWLQFTAVMLLLAADGLTFFCFWQLSALAIFSLNRSTRRAAGDAEQSLRRFLSERAADAALLLGLFLIGHDGGTLGLTADWTAAGPIASANGEQAASLLIGWCLLVPVVVRCGLFPATKLRQPLNRPSSAAALAESALFLPTGIYLLARGLPFVVMSPSSQAAVIGVGSVSALVGAIAAAVQSDNSRRLPGAALSLYGLVAAGLATNLPLGIAAALLLLGVTMLAMPDLWIATEAGDDRRPTTGVRWAALASAALLCSGIWGQFALLAALAETARQAGDGPRGVLLSAGYWLDMASLPCLSFALMRGFLSPVTRGGAENGNIRPSSRSSRSVAAWLLAVAAIALPALMWSAPERFNLLASFPAAAGIAIEPSSLLMVDVGFPLVLLGAVAAWWSASVAGSKPERNVSVFTAAWNRVRGGFGWLNSGEQLIGRPVRGLAQVCRLIEVWLFGRGGVWLTRQLLIRPVRALGAPRIRPVPFYALSVLLAAAVTLLVLTGIRG